jgi:asparaginyl-tRNA synthetase
VRSQVHADICVVAQEGREQAVELQATKVVYVGPCAEGYPLHKGKTKISNETLRNFSHLRPRTNIMGATLRVRDCAAV